MHIRRLILILGVSLIVLPFQNCGQTGAASGGEISNDKVLGDTSTFKNITFDEGLEYRPLSAGRLEVDLDAGTVKVDAVLCAPNLAKLAAIRNLLSNSKICEPGPLPPNTAACMAIGLADVELTGASGSLLLRPLICNSGTYLCGDSDKSLRALLKSLREDCG